MSPRTLRRRAPPPEHTQQQARFTCQGCRQLGFGLFESGPGRPDGQTPISVSSGFSIRRAGGKAEIVCGCCQAVLAV